MKMAPKRRFKTCEICGNRVSRENGEKRRFMAKFPLDEDRCRQWVKFVGNEDLVFVPIEKLHELKYVCEDHFDDIAFNKKRNRLNKSAVPTKNLKANPLPEDMLVGFPSHVHHTYTAGPSNTDSSSDKLNEEKTGIEGDSKPIKPKKEPPFSEEDYSSYYKKRASFFRPLNIEKMYDGAHSELDKENNGQTDNATIDRKNILVPKHSFPPSFLRDHTYFKPVTKLERNIDDYLKEGYKQEKQETASDTKDDQDGPCDDNHEVESPQAIFSWEKADAVIADDTDLVSDAAMAAAEMTLDLGNVSMYGDDELRPSKHRGDVTTEYRCNECGKVIEGFRYTCVQCVDFDLCPLCEARAAHGEHYVLRVPAARAYSEIQSVLTAIRQQILSEKLFLTAVGDSLKTEIKLESDEVPDAVIDLNDASPNTNEATPGANNPFPIDLYNHFPELDDPMPDFVTVPTIDPLDESVSDIENSRAESNDSRDDNPSVQNNSVESNITALRCSDTENSPQRKRHCPKPFSKTYGDSINLSHLRILKNPSDESTERPQVTFNPFVNIRSLKPIPWDCEPEKEREDQRTIGVVDKANRKRVLAHARKRRTLRRKTHRKAEDLSADEADEISPRLQDTRLPESPRLSPHILKRKSRKTKSSPVENRVLRSTERKKEQRVEERVESESEDKRNSEEISKPEFTLQLPADTNVEALIQALQCQVSVRLKRDF